MYHLVTFEFRKIRARHMGEEKYLHNPGVPYDCTSDQSCKYILHEFMR